MNQIKYVFGDATEPQGSGVKVIPHICNNVGAWGAGFVIALNKKWPHVEEAYKKWHAEKDKPAIYNNSNFRLGNIQIVRAEPDIYVCNMIAQYGLRARGSLPPIRYMALAECLLQLADEMEYTFKGSIHAPKFGAGLAGGDWNAIEALIHVACIDKGIPVTIYEYGAQDDLG